MRKGRMAFLIRLLEKKQLDKNISREMCEVYIIPTDMLSFEVFIQDLSQARKRQEGTEQWFMHGCNY